MAVNHVPGTKKGEVMLYALSTCVWCKKTKKLLEDMNIDFYFTDVDLLDSQEKEKAKDEIKKWNPACSFPSMVIDNKVCIVGFDEAKIKDALK
jgi:glutaredoxin-like protein NrdH